MKVLHTTCSMVCIALALIMLMSQCDQPVTSFSYDDEPELKRRSELVIEVVDIKGNPLTDFSVQVVGPSQSQHIVKGSELKLETELAGNYIIRIEKAGYIGFVFPLTVFYPEGLYSENQMNVTATLVPLEPPTLVNNTNEVVIRGGFSPQRGTGIVPTELLLPAGALGASSTIDLSITRTSAISLFGPISTIGNLTVVEVLGMNQTSVALTKQAQWRIPLFTTPQIKELRPQYWLIPVVWDHATGSFTVSGPAIPASIDSNYDIATFNISTLSSYVLATNIGLRLTIAQSTTTQLSRSSCGLKSEVVYQIDSGTALSGTLYMNPNLPQVSQNISAQRWFSGVDRHRVVVQVSHAVQTWQLLHPTTGSIVEQSKIKMGPIRFDVYQQRCLDSGGS